MRLDARTNAAEQLEAWAGKHKLHYVGAIRETQSYVRVVEQGLTLFDLPVSKVQADLKQWQPILDWVDAAWQAAEGSAGTAKAAVGAVTRPIASGKSPAPVRTPLPAAQRDVPAAPASRFVIDAPKRVSSPTLADRFGRLFTVFRPSN